MHGTSDKIVDMKDFLGFFEAFLCDPVNQNIVTAPVREVLPNSKRLVAKDRVPNIFRRNNTWIM